MVAQWKPHTYQITYNANGGDVGTVPGTQTKTYGVTLTLQTKTLEYLGYGFTGWNTAPDGSGTTYAPGGLFDINANTTLYAQWEPNTHLVTYDANGGAADTVPDAQTKYYAVPLQLTREPPTREGYKFVCWSATPDGDGAVYDPGEEYTVDEDVTLYAQWKVKNGMNAKIKNRSTTAVGTDRENVNRFRKGEYGIVSIESIKGEVVNIEISSPDHLRSFAEPEDLLDPYTLTVDHGLSGDGSTGLAEFFIPINFDDTAEYHGNVTVTATFADGEVITQTPDLIVVPKVPIPIPIWFRTRLL